MGHQTPWEVSLTKERETFSHPRLHRGMTRFPKYSMSHAPLALQKTTSVHIAVGCGLHPTNAAGRQEPWPCRSSLNSQVLVTGMLYGLCETVQSLQLCLLCEKGLRVTPNETAEWLKDGFSWQTCHTSQSDPLLVPSRRLLLTAPPIRKEQPPIFKFYSFFEAQLKYKNKQQTKQIFQHEALISRAPSSLSFPKSESPYVDASHLGLNLLPGAVF